MSDIKSVPDLRFSEFKSPWSLLKLGSVTTKVGSGSTPRGGRDVYVNEGIPFIRSQNVNENRLNTTEMAYISDEVHSSMRASYVEANDILLNITGASIGRSCVVPRNFNTGNVNQHVCIIRLKDEHDSYFYQLFLSSYAGQKSIQTNQAGGGREGLNFQGVRDIKLNAPDILEQQKIAEFLSAVDQKITQLSEKLELLREYKKGVMQQLFSQQIRFKDDHGNDYPEWIEKMLGDLAKFSKGKSISKKDISKDGTTPCIRYGELYTTYQEVIDNPISATNLDPSELVLSLANDVIIPASGESNVDIATAACVLQNGIALSGDLNIIRGEFNGVFMAYYLNSFKRFDIAKLAQGNSVVHLYNSQLSSLKVLIPCIEEQKKVANFIREIDHKIEQANASLEQAKIFKKGLLQKMFV